MKGHTLKVALDRDTVCLSIVCHELDGEFCRRTCNKGCDTACTNPDIHIKPINYCLGVEWVSLDGDAGEAYSGDDELLLCNGMSIDLSWNAFEERWTWTVAAQTPTELQEASPT